MCLKCLMFWCPGCVVSLAARQAFKFHAKVIAVCNCLPRSPGLVLEGEKQLPVDVGWGRKECVEICANLDIYSDFPRDFCSGSHTFTLLERQQYVCCGRSGGGGCGSGCGVVSLTHT